MIVHINRLLVFLQVFFVIVQYGENCARLATQINGSSVGGYLLLKDGDSMPIFVKYANSQYADRFLNPQEDALVQQGQTQSRLA